MSKMFVRKYDYVDNGTPMYAIILWHNWLGTCIWSLINGTITHNKQERDNQFLRRLFSCHHLIGFIENDPPNELQDMEIHDA